MYSGEGENSENIHVELNEQNTSTPAIITLNGNDDNQIINPGGSQPSDSDDSQSGTSSSGTPHQYDIDYRETPIRYRKLSYETVQKRISSTYDLDCLLYTSPSPRD